MKITYKLTIDGFNEVVLLLTDDEGKSRKYGKLFASVYGKPIIITRVTEEVDFVVTKNQNGDLPFTPSNPVATNHKGG